MESVDNLLAYLKQNKLNSARFTGEFYVPNLSEQYYFFDPYQPSLGVKKGYRLDGGKLHDLQDYVNRVVPKLRGLHLVCYEYFAWLFYPTYKSKEEAQKAFDRCMALRDKFLKDYSMYWRDWKESNYNEQDYKENLVPISLGVIEPDYKK
jgi:hypothetical protein